MIPEVDSRRVSGREIEASGRTVIAKVSLWSSQADLVKLAFDWSENCERWWEWFETVYEEKKNSDSAPTELTFAFYLQPRDVEHLMKELPISLVRFLRVEPFQVALFDYYHPAGGSRNGIATL